MERNQRTGDDAGQLDRRTVLKLTGAAAGSTVAMSGVVSAKRGNGKGNGGGKSGGRGQTSDEVLLNEPFTVSYKKRITTNASCMSDNSAQQEYIRYNFDYCDPNLGGGTICVIPDDSELDEDRVYEFRSKQRCKAPSSDYQHRFSFGPSNSDHDC